MMVMKVHSEYEDQEEPVTSWMTAKSVEQCEKMFEIMLAEEFPYRYINLESVWAVPTGTYSP